MKIKTIFRGKWFYYRFVLAFLRPFNLMALCDGYSTVTYALIRNIAGKFLRLGEEWGDSGRDFFFLTEWETKIVLLIAQTGIFGGLHHVMEHLSKYHLFHLFI